MMESQSLEDRLSMSREPLQVLVSNLEQVGDKRRKLTFYHYGSNSIRLQGCDVIQAVACTGGGFPTQLLLAVRGI
jgi:hypothetical protein